MFPASGPGAPQQQAAPQQPSPWAPPGAQAMPSTPPQPGFQPPQQQGFGRPPQQQQPPYQPPAQGFQPPQQQGFGSQPGAARPISQPPAANPYAPPGAPNPYAPPQQQYGQQPYAQQPYGQPPQQQPYSPQPQPAQSMPPTAMPPPAGAKKSGKGLIIGLVAAVAVAGGIVAFVMLRGGGGVAGGGSRSAVVKSTLSALGDGDVDQLMKLTAIPELFEKISDCKSDADLTTKDKEDRDPKKQVEKRKKELEAIASFTKGAKIELVEITNSEPPAPKDDDASTDGDDSVLKKGQEVTKGCVAKTNVRLHSAKLKLKVTPKGEKAIEQESEMTLMQIGTGFYLAQTPSMNLGTAALEKELGAIKNQVCACKDAECAEKLKMEFKASPRSKALKKQIKALSDEDEKKIDAIEDEIKACERKLDGGDDQLEAMIQFKDKICACNDKQCADKVTQEMTVWANSHKDGKLSEDDTAKATKIGEEMGKCVTRIYSQPDPSTGGGGGIGSTIASAGGVAELSGDMPGQCQDYRASVLEAANCPKLPQASRQALLDSYKQMADAWKSIDFKTLPAASLETIEKSCKQGVDAMKQMMKTLGC